MCITSAPAEMGSTRAYTYANLDTSDSHNWHVTGYQNTARNLSPAPNCMMLHFPGSQLRLVDGGPEHTKTMMEDITRDLPALEETRGLSRSFAAPGAAQVVEYGDYHVVVAQNAHDIPRALDHIPDWRRPMLTRSLMDLIGWYGANFPGYSFVLACFSGSVNPTHPIVVEYIPHNDDVLFIPGLDGHDGQLPSVGAPMHRDFRVAFGYEGNVQPFTVNYRDDIAHQRWAPRDVTGFWDNRTVGPNQDYVVSLQDTNFGLAGNELLLELIS